MEVREVSTEEGVRVVSPVVRQLRTHLGEEELVSAVGRMRTEGYRLIAAYDDDEGGKPFGAAGFRVYEMLAYGKILYVDDLVTAEDVRSGGVGRALIGWKKKQGVRDAQACTSTRGCSARGRTASTSGRGWRSTTSTSRRRSEDGPRRRR